MHRRITLHQMYAHQLINLHAKFIQINRALHGVARALPFHVCTKFQAHVLDSELKFIEPVFGNWTATIGKLHAASDLLIVIIGGVCIDHVPLIVRIDAMHQHGHTHVAGNGFGHGIEHLRANVF